MAVTVIALIVLGIADLVTTLIGLKRGATEANPAAAPLAKSPVLMIVLKCICTAIICGVLIARPSWWPPLGLAFIAGYVVVLFNNVRAVQGKQTIF